MTPLKIYCDARLSDAALHLLRKEAAPHELIFSGNLPGSVLEKAAPGPSFATADIAIGQPDDEAVLAAPRLRWVQLSTAGYTRYDTPQFRAAAARRGLMVTTGSGVYAEACAEHVLAFMLAQARRLPQSLATRCGSSEPAWGALRQAGRPLRRQRVIIFGYGGIARRLVEMLAPFQMQVTAVRRSPQGDEGVTVVSPGEAAGPLAEADHVVNILPENPESRHYFNAERFAEMKSEAVFYNIGRGTTVDQEALAKALRSGRLREAWLDVTEPEPLPENHVLRHTSNCFITPHVAGGHADESLTLAWHFLENLRRFIQNEPLVDRVM